MSTGRADRPRLQQLVRDYWWMLAALPSIGQLGLLIYAMMARWGYPYDLEWMEGGMLVHAHRLAHGTGIYVEPSIEFIPYLYTPLYPWLLAVLEPVFGISYAVGRGISILATLVCVALCFVVIVRPLPSTMRRIGLLGAALAVGFFAATYPWLDGWFDLTRGDALFLAMVVAGVWLSFHWSDAHSSEQRALVLHGKIGIAAALMGLSFFCKQTGVFYVVAGGAVVLVRNWRLMPTYVVTAGLVGLGGTAIANSLTDGWFWTYVFEVHQTHDCNQDRFNRSFANIIAHFPLMSVVIVGALGLVITAWAHRREMPAYASALLLWSWIFAISTLVGAVGFATQWAHFNAYLPAMLTGAIAAGAALPAITGALQSLHAPPRVQTVVTGAVVLALCGQLLTAFWRPAQFIPSPAQRAAGDQLIETIAAMKGEVLIPFHPWYGHLADKPVYAHRMGVLDVSFRPAPRPTPRQCIWHNSEGRTPFPVRGLAESFSRQQFAAIIWDNRPIDSSYFPGLKQNYRLDDFLPKQAQPKTISGASVQPQQIWRPVRPATTPPGASAVFSFETTSSWTKEGFVSTGTAWGRRPTRGPLPGQGPVRRYGGAFFANSWHGKDKSVGTLTTPSFSIAGTRLSLRISGGVEDPSLAGLRRPTNQKDSRPWLRVELYVDGQQVHHASKSGSASERMDEIVWDVAEYRGKTAHLVLVDNATAAWGHLNMDEVWLWQ